MVDTGLFSMGKKEEDSLEEKSIEELQEIVKTESDKKKEKEKKAELKLQIKNLRDKSKTENKTAEGLKKVGTGLGNGLLALGKHMGKNLDNNEKKKEGKGVDFLGLG